MLDRTISCHLVADGSVAIQPLAAGVPRSHLRLRSGKQHAANGFHPKNRHADRLPACPPTQSIRFVSTPHVRVRSRSNVDMALIMMVMPAAPPPGPHPPRHAYY